MNLPIGARTCTSPGAIRTCSMMLVVAMTGIIYILYAGEENGSSVKPYPRLVGRKSRHTPVKTSHFVFNQLTDDETIRDTTDDDMEYPTYLRATTTDGLLTTSEPVLKNDTTTAPFIDTTRKTVHILLTAYHRSGSSFTGSLLSSQPNTFFFFEPFMKIGGWNHFTANNQLCNDLSGICRRLNGTSSELLPLHQHMKRYNVSDTETFDEILYRLIQNVYDCRLDGTEDLIVEPVTNMFTETLKKLWYPYTICRRNATMHDCLPLVTQSCQKSRFRVIKLVRFTLDMVGPLLQRDPHLKVVHLFRDPRGTICSRLVKTWWYPLRVQDEDYTTVKRNAEILCSRMLVDYEAGVELIKLFPNRVKLLRYEDLNDKGEFIVKTEIMPILGLSSFESLPQMSKQSSANDWMKHLNWKVIDIVDSVCSEVYKKLGYNHVNYQTWLNTNQS